MFHPSDHVSNLEFLATFKKGASLSGMSDGVSTWQVKYFMNEFATAAALVSLLYRKDRKTITQAYVVPSFWKDVVSCFLETYATDTTITETETEVQNFRMPSNITLS